MSFEQAAAQLPTWVQYWLNVIVVVPSVSMLVLLFWKQTRRLALICIALFALGIGGVMLIFSQMGFVRLMGLGHVIFWTPLCILVWQHIKNHNPTGVVRVALWALLIVVAAALAFDIADVVRWILGERAPMVSIS
ncbi:MAG: hypothetical protein AAGF28_11820 [Pseudomonadota bacterium]